MKIEDIDKLSQLESCISLFIEVFNAEPWKDEWSYDSAKKRLLDFFITPRFIGLYIKDRDVITGCLIGNIEAYFNGDYFYLKEMFISPDYQRKGYGQKLLKALFSRLEGRNIRSIFLFTNRNYFPHDFYIKNGFNVFESMDMLNIHL